MSSRKYNLRTQIQDAIVYLGLCNGFSKLMFLYTEFLKINTSLQNWMISKHTMICYSICMQCGSIRSPQLTHTTYRIAAMKCTRSIVGLHIKIARHQTALNISRSNNSSLSPAGYTIAQKDTNETLFTKLKGLA